MSKIEVLFSEKTRILQAFVECVRKYRDLFEPKSESNKTASADQKLTWVDALTDEREAHYRMLQLIDQQIEAERILTEPEALAELESSKSFITNVEQILYLAKEIQLTDQSLFLYINNIGFEIRSQILKSLKEKEALSKFKSSNQTPTGEGFDQKA